MFNIKIINVPLVFFSIVLSSDFDAAAIILSTSFQDIGLVLYRRKFLLATETSLTLYNFDLE
jgi:hypothetical protein